LKDELLVSTEQLAAHLGDAHWIVFDVRGELADPGKGPRLYAESHIPGAYYMHMEHDLSGAKNGRNGRHPLPDIATFAAKMSARGVSPGRQVVVYDEGGGSFASRLWWMLRWLGHDRAALLDGGFAAWEKDGRPVDNAVPAPRAGHFEPRPLLGAIADVHYVEAYRQNRAVRLVDARAHERFTGEQETIDPVAGHIPGAVNRFWRQNLGPDGRFKSPDILREEYLTLLGDSLPSLTVHQCGSGVTACHNIFAMELADLPGSRLYPGSWSEWCADPARPVAKGEQ
jgi:thiosulfate/3-mercaptopyruvate sulfurtransferase